MVSSDLIRLTAAQTAAAVASGEVSAVEVSQAHLDRIDAVDERVHAFLHVDTEGVDQCGLNLLKNLVVRRHIILRMKRGSQPQTMSQAV